MRGTPGGQITGEKGDAAQDEGDQGECERIRCADADSGLDIDLTPMHDPTEPEPVPDIDFDQSHGA